jgi:hypothetical protein
VLSCTRVSRPPRSWARTPAGRVHTSTGLPVLPSTTSAASILDRRGRRQVLRPSNCRACPQPRGRSAGTASPPAGCKGPAHGPAHAGYMRAQSPSPQGFARPMRVRLSILSRNCSGARCTVRRRSSGRSRRSAGRAYRSRRHSQSGLASVGAALSPRAPRCSHRSMRVIVETSSDGAHEDGVETGGRNWPVDIG